MNPAPVYPLAAGQAVAQTPNGLGYSTRYANAQDAPRLMALMRQLAEFEGYADRMTVTENDLIERGLGTPSLGQFSAIVAQSDLGELWGYAVVYSIPFTYDLQPTLVLKEFLVTESARGIGVGRSLFQHVTAHAQVNHCRLLKWDVLPSNERAKAFYRSCGGADNVDWENWVLPASQL
jgi:ribosomal protein S18 acetylase RimI-like enzyme